MKRTTTRWLVAMACLLLACTDLSLWVARDLLAAAITRIAQGFNRVMTRGEALELKMVPNRNVWGNTIKNVTHVHPA